MAGEEIEAKMKKGSILHINYSTLLSGHLLHALFISKMWKIKGKPKEIAFSSANLGGTFPSTGCGFEF